MSCGRSAAARHRRALRLGLLSPGSAVRAVAGLAVALLVACSPQRDKTPLPTRQTTIDPVLKKLDAAGAQADKRREEMEAASK